MKDNKLEQLKKEYMEVPIPAELDFVVKKALKASGVSDNRKKKSFKQIKRAVASIAAALVILAAGANISPVFAETMSKVPVVGGLVKVLTFREYKVDEDTYDAKIQVPAVEGLKNKELENSINEKYLAENKELYEQFMADMKELEENGGGHMGVDSGYVVKTDTDRLLSIGRYVVNTVGSSSTTMRYDTIDKEKEILLTLPSLFKDESYVDIISENIKQQMVEQYKADSNNYYWVEGIEQEMLSECFKRISKEQNFYIDPEGKLVISFDKYEVAPGYMGVVEFVIPTEPLADILAGSDYIK
jgi:hypothetical protein